MATPLLVIDMQPFFDDTASKCLDGVLHQIKLAKRRNDPIIITEYARCGPSYPEIYDAVEGYTKAICVAKYSDGGGVPVIEAAKQNDIDLKKVRVVGVNRSWCVRSTVYDLTKMITDLAVEVVKSATWCDSPESGLLWLKDMGCRLK